MNNDPIVKYITKIINDYDEADKKNYKTKMDCLLGSNKNNRLNFRTIKKIYFLIYNHHINKLENKLAKEYINVCRNKILSAMILYKIDLDTDMEYNVMFLITFLKYHAKMNNIISKDDIINATICFTNKFDLISYIYFVKYFCKYKYFYSVITKYHDPFVSLISSIKNNKMKKLVYSFKNSTIVPWINWDIFLNYLLKLKKNNQKYKFEYNTWIKMCGSDFLITINNAIIMMINTNKYNYNININKFICNCLDTKNKYNDNILYSQWKQLSFKSKENTATNKKYIFVIDFQSMSNKNIINTIAKLLLYLLKSKDIYNIIGFIHNGNNPVKINISLKRDKTKYGLNIIQMIRELNKLAHKYSDKNKSRIISLCETNETKMLKTFDYYKYVKFSNIIITSFEFVVIANYKKHELYDNEVMSEYINISDSKYL